MKKAPGKAYRKGLTLLEVADMFRDEQSSRAWIESMAWPDGPECPHCGSKNVQCDIKHKTQTHRCRDCPKRPMFTVRVNTVMQGTKMSYRTWAIGIYLFTTNIKGVSSMRLHRELGIGQKAAWFMMHRLREAYAVGESTAFKGSVEVDETYIGGKEGNKHESKKLHAGRGAVGKMAVVGAKHRDTNQVTARVMHETTGVTIRGFVRENVEKGSNLFTDEAGAYKSLKEFNHEAVKHSVGEYVRDMAHTNGIESFWASLKRGYIGIYHKMSPKHLDRYVDEFTGRHNNRPLDTENQMSNVVKGMREKRLKYDDLIADNGLASGARGNLFE